MMTMSCFSGVSLRRLIHVRAFVPIVALAMWGCGNEPASAPVTPESELLWRAQMTPHGGLTMALNDTVQTTVVGLNLDQHPITLDPSNVSVTYATDDSTYVAVSSTGQIVGRQVTNLFSPVRVVANINVGGVKSADTVLVAVTATQEVVDSVSLMPDSLHASMFSLVFFRPTAWGGGQPLYDVFVYFSSSSNSLLMDPIFAYALSLTTGPAWMYASTTAYGKTFIDSVQFNFLVPASGDEYISDLQSGGFTLNPDWSNVTYFFQSCAALTWYNTSSHAVNVTFSDPQNTGRCGEGDVTDTGDILNLQPGASATRKFPAAGSHTWSLAVTSDPSKILNTGTIQTQ